MTRPLPPIYYVPQGKERPAHVAGIAPVAIPTEVPTPDGGSGITINGLAEAGMKWHEGTGWWVAYRDESLPAATMRVNASPGYLVAGWLVPKLVDVHGVAAVGYFGPNGWTIPGRYRDIVARLLGHLDYVGPITDEHAVLAADILALNYHISLHELDHFQVLDRGFAGAVLRAACSFPPREA